MKTIPIGPFLGINNKLPPFSLHVDKVGDYLSAGENIDIDDKGNIRRRRKEAKVVDIADAHSLYLTSDTAGYVVRGGVLYAITLPAYTETLVKILSNDNAGSWATIGGRLYFSNSTDSGCVSGEDWLPMAMPTPDAPDLTAIAGNLLAGNYQVSVSYVRKSGTDLLEESGRSHSSTIELGGNGGVRVTLPAAEDGATHVNIYLSDANGTVPYLAATVAAGTATHDCISLGTGRQIADRVESPLPAGKLFTSLGRLCIIVGSAVYVGVPFRPGYYLPVGGYIKFLSDVSLAIENQGGTYLCADKTYWIPGDLLDSAERMSMILPYGAVPGTEFRHSDSPLVGWFGAHGLVLADTGGQAKALTEEAIDLTAPASGVSAVINEGGYLRVASCGWCVNLGNKAGTQYTGWDFTSVSGSYGTKTDGIYRITDDAPADAVIGLGKLNFRSELLKHLPAVYLGVASETPMLLRVQAPGDVDYTYQARSGSGDLQMQRIDPGKGLRATWFELSLMNQDGADFNTLASVSFAAASTTRRI